MGERSPSWNQARSLQPPRLLPEWPQTADFSVSPARADQSSPLARGHSTASPIAILS